MFSRFFKRLASDSAALPRGRVPTGTRVYAIGDVHGRLDLLDELLQLIAADEQARAPAQRQLILLGDLIDRGADSAGVVERVRQLVAAVPGTRVLMGNHEEVMLLALEGNADALKLFARIGGRETMLSYGLTADEIDALEPAALAERLQSAVPAAHRAFVEGMENLIAIGDYAFVHAGIRPGVPLHSQLSSDLRWIRKGFLNHGEPLEAIVVHGHTITAEVEYRVNRIGIDTGAYASGRLTALGLEGGEQWLVQTGTPAA